MALIEELDSFWIICPFCGYKSEGWDHYTDEMEWQEDDFECGECGEIFMAGRSVSITYYTKAEVK
jgi:hypothetical protein